jgi:hypothetical protein
MAEWRVQLQGNNFDLQELKGMLSDHDPTIIQENSDFYLKSKDWDQLEEAKQVRDRAKLFIESLDSAAYVYFMDTAPIMIGRIVRADDDGHRQNFILLEGHLVGHSRLRATATVTGPDDQPVESQQERSITRTLGAMAKHPSVADALRFFRKGDWISLYKAYEIVRDEVGEKEIIRQGWLAEKSKSRFTQMAQSREALGDDARHASAKYKPPQEPMSILEAKAIIGDLMQKWINTL